MLNPPKLRKLALASSILMGVPLSGLAQPASSAGAAADDAASPQSRSRVLEEVTVTARRREESLQEVPVAITALSSMRIQEASIQSISHLTALVPGLRFGAEGGRSNTSVSLRGLSKLPIGEGVPAVVAYFAEAPLPGEGVDVPTYDLANIQVLKGPQGTLFGRNTLGGAVLISPEAPTYAPEGYLQATVGNYNYKVLEGAVNAPLIEDTLAVRFAGQWRDRDGTTENLNGGHDFDDIHQHAGRLSILWDPAENLSNTLILDYFKAAEQPGGEIIISARPQILSQIFTPFFGPDYGNALAEDVRAYAAAQQAAGPWKAFSNLDDQHMDRESKGIVNTTTWDITSDITLKNIFSYREAFISTQINTGGVGPLIPELGGFTLFHAASLSDREFLTNELQLQGQSFDDRLEWIVGAFYSNDKSNAPMGSTFVQFDPLIDGSDATSVTSHIENRNKALFSQIGVDLSEWLVSGLTLNLGYRYSWDEVEACGGTFASGYVSVSDCERTAALGLADGTGVIKNDGDAPTYTIGLDWAATDNLFFYVTHRRGYRGVGVNTPRFETLSTTGGFSTGPAGCSLGGMFVTCPDLRPFQQTEEETLEDFEIGMRSDWMAGNVPVRLNVAAFQADYKDGLQFFNAVNLTGVPASAPDAPTRGSIGVNAADITIQGVELEAIVQPTDRLTLSANGSYVDQEIDKLTVPPIGGLALTENQVTLPTPRFSGTLALRWELPVRPLDGDLIWNIDYYYTSEWDAQVGVELPSYEITNTRLDWNNISGSGVSVGAWARNLTDEEYATSPTVLIPAFPTSTVFFGEPRTFGVDVRYTWGG